VSRHGGPFNWVIGGFYNEQKRQNDYVEHLPGHPWVAFGTLPNPDEIEYASYVTSKVTEKAIFGEGTFKVTPKWQLTAGARYFSYKANAIGVSVLPLLGDPLSPYDVTPAGGTKKKSGLVWKFNSSYNFTPDIMVYGTYSKGYRIGGANTVAGCILPLDLTQQNVCALPNEQFFNSDTTKNAELGIRTQLLDRKLTFNINVFQIKWRGVQLNSATLFGVVGIKINGDKAKSEGFETSFQLRPLRGLSVQGTYSYVNAKLTSDVPLLISVNDPGGTYPSAPIRLDALAGDRLPGSAKNSGSLGVTYTMPFKDGEIIADWTTTYRGNIVTRIGWERAYGDKLPSYVLHRASLAYETKRYGITLFVNNIFDKYAVNSVDNDRSRVGLNDGVRLRYYKRSVINPRTFGIEARIKY